MLKAARKKAITTESPNKAIRPHLKIFSFAKKGFVRSGLSLWRRSMDILR